MKEQSRRKKFEERSELAIEGRYAEKRREERERT
jgi:hypothetical protein